jgi:hypothetical protein
MAGIGVPALTAFAGKSDQDFLGIGSNFDEVKKADSSR